MKIENSASEEHIWWTQVKMSAKIWNRRDDEEKEYLKHSARERSLSTPQDNRKRAQEQK